MGAVNKYDSLKVDCVDYGSLNVWHWMVPAHTYIATNIISAHGPYHPIPQSCCCCRSILDAKNTAFTWLHQTLRGRGRKAYMILSEIIES